MNENINLVNILKDCPKGTKLYSTIYGCVEFDYIQEDCEYPIVIRAPKYDNREIITSDGRMHKDYEGECTLFPSQEQRDWNKWVCPKKPRFNPKTLRAFDKVLVKLSNDDVWDADFFSHYNPLEKCMKYVCVANLAVFCIPYNDDTKHLVGTTEEAPEYYRYWEE